jgi:two-component system response regulator AtoC
MPATVNWNARKVIRWERSKGQMKKILIVDDEPTMVSMLSDMLRRPDREVLPVGNASRALAVIRDAEPDLVVTDINLPEGHEAGLDLLRQCRELRPSLPVIVLTGHGTKAHAITALRAGAQDFVEKPFQADELLRRVDTALFQKDAVRALCENADLKRQLGSRSAFGNFVGETPAVRAVQRLVARVAPTGATVLIRGESGTGKELVARALHDGSRRAAMPFVAINCAALPEHLLESELFGHRKSAFTGAAFDKVGLFQAADGGTIFLDEIGSMPLNLQSKLLRFLQDRELRRVGDTEPITVDVRVIAATNEPLETRIAEKTFRQDLYYRLNVVQIELPPLRERREDIALLAMHFLRIIAQRERVDCPRLTPAAMESLSAYHWPGNVRELQNLIERACLLSETAVIDADDLHRWLAPAPAAAAEAADGGAEPVVPPRHARIIPLKEFIRQQEFAYIQRALAVTRSNKTRAAKLLGVSGATLHRKLVAGEPPAGAGDVSDPVECSESAEALA